jgi:hypothetical protein
MSRNDRLLKQSYSSRLETDPIMERRVHKLPMLIGVTLVVVGHEGHR